MLMKLNNPIFKVILLRPYYFIQKLCLINILTIHNSISHPPPRLPNVGAVLLSMRMPTQLLQYLYGASSGTAYGMWPVRPQAPATASEWFYFSLGSSYVMHRRMSYAIVLCMVRYV